MEVRGRRYNLDNQVIALGNSKTKNVEGYAYVSEIFKIPFTKIMEYESDMLKALYQAVRALFVSWIILLAISEFYEEVSDFDFCGKEILREWSKPYTTQGY